VDVVEPLIGAVFLDDLHHCTKRCGLIYVLLMDDILVFATTRWKLRAAVKAVNGMLHSLRLEKHPGKTFIRNDRGFGFLGYRLVW